MSLQQPCPSCATPLALPDDLGEKKVRCPKCGTIFGVPTPSKVEDDIVSVVPVDENEARAALQSRPGPSRTPPGDWSRKPTVRRADLSRPKPQPQGSAGGVLLIVGGIALAGLLLVCTGIGVGGWLWLRSVSPSNAGPVLIVDNSPPPMVNPVARPPMADAGPPQPLPKNDFPPFQPPAQLPPRPLVPPPPVDPPGPPVPPFQTAPNPFREGTQTRLRQLQTLKAPGNAVQLAYSPQHELLFLRNSASGVWVMDVKTGQSLGMQSAQHRFTDMAMAPDETALFVADYGGERTGYGDPIHPSYVHRYDLAARKWEHRKAPKIAYRLETVDSWRMLLLEQDQWVAVTLNRWDQKQEKITELARTSSNYSGDIEYDPRTGRIYHGNRGISSPEINVCRVVGDTLRGAVEGSGTYGTASKGGGGGGVALSVDGTRFYYGKLQVEALDVKHNLRSFPTVIVAGSRDLAFGAGTYFNAHTGEKLGNLPGTVHAISRDGMVLWTITDGPNTLTKFAIDGDK